MKTLIFAERNFKEIIRDLLSVIFSAAFPILLFLVFQIIISSIPEAGMTNAPQFEISRLTPSVTVLGFSFITLFAGMLISKDRTTSFSLRLNCSPMKSMDFILGYTLPLIPLALIQIVLIFTLGMFFGLKFNVRIFLTVIVMIPSAFLFIGIGLLIGSVFNDKAVGGVASIIINLSAILGGMFFPLDNMNGALVTVAYILPFANCIKSSSAALNGDFNEMVKPLIITICYSLVIFIVAVIVFNRKRKSDIK